VDERPLNQEYSREEAKRVVDVSERQLRSWEKQKLIPPSQSFGFSELVALKTLVKLRQQKFRPERIRQVITALRKTLSGIENPLAELKIFSEGKRIGVQISGRRMEAISGQLLFDFDTHELNKLLLFPAKGQHPNERRARQSQKVEAELWFQRALDLEQSGAPVEEIIEAYERASELDEQSAGALVNLGTLHFNARRWSDAERYYRRALDADPNYALAHFNLGNLYDEKGDRGKALNHYIAAIRLHSTYADAHYNIALLYQTSGQVMKAVRHWRIYLKLDPGSSWSIIARRELDKLRKATVLDGKRLGPVQNG
jgi:tetratricopeptide (TPR) repeat protein